MNKVIESTRSPIAAVSIDYRDAGRIGVIIPSANVVAEHEIRAMAPPGIGVHFTRVALRGTTSEDLVNMEGGADEAAMMLADAGVDQIVFHCTAVTTFDNHIGSRISRRITELTGVPAFSTSEAIVNALRALRATNIVLSTPYNPAIHEREIQFLKANGFNVVADSRMDNTDDVRALDKIPQAEIERCVLDEVHARADAYFVSCTAIRSAPLIASLEAALNRPVITSNQAMIWYALSRLGRLPAPPGFGRLLDVTGEA